MATISFNYKKGGTKTPPLEVAIQKDCWSWLSTILLDSRGAIIAGTADSDINVLKLQSLQTYSYMVPNGLQLGGGRQRRGQYMASLKAQGFKPGVSDMVIAYPKATGMLGPDYNGAYIELKRDVEAYKGPAARRAALRPEQRDWLELMLRVGYWGAVAYGLDDFKQLVRNYLAGESPRPLDFIPEVSDTS